MSTGPGFASGSASHHVRLVGVLELAARSYTGTDHAAHVFDLIASQDHEAGVDLVEEVRELVGTIGREPPQRGDSQQAEAGRTDPERGVTPVRARSALDHAPASERRASQNA